ncbi:hypothetical protein [Egicoccus halophilus]|uniref:Carboxypeptidase regulatory-like domain-containing protein n=1 Tax=Egicoccus halophilus TaxID=1670830 RepID=A0A8J3EUY5_9ACTN|nr:hypothetical protein [Egicoccus halophilus]GGI08598.1 hypothetical protein GCM10011354_29880 [Egicoccus halophilus]
MDENRLPGDVPPDVAADDLDELLLAELTDLAAQFDPVPPEAVLAARSSLAWLRLDAALAELVHDSAVEAEPVGVRGGAHGRVRQLSFAAGIAEVELEIEVTGPRRRLVGQCLPSATAQLTIRQPAGERTAQTDDLGRFTLEVEPGPLSLRCAWPHLGQAVETAWVTV